MRISDDTQALIRTGANLARRDMEKNASLLDALIGAPVGALAAALSANKEDRTKAVSRGLLLGALLGFLMGQKSVAESMNRSPEDIIYGRKPEEEESVLTNPLVASGLAGLGAGLYYRARH